MSPLDPHDLHVSMPTTHHQAGVNSQLVLSEPYEQHNKHTLMELRVDTCGFSLPPLTD